MNGRNDSHNMALFCDFENVALGVRDVKLAAFDINKVLERLLLKGNIVVKKSYCDWQRYKDFKAPMHEAAFELIEIPHVRQSGKNSADIRMVVDALDLCYTKEHVDTFVIISGDSDFSPLVSKLRENNKLVIGVGVKQSTSDLLTSNCDEFIYYDDLVREAATTSSGRRKTKRSADKKHEGIDRLLSIIGSLEAEYDPLWGSLVKQTIRRVYPGFNEAYYGYRTFADLLKDAESQSLIKLEYDESRGNYKVRLSVGGKS